MGMTDTYGRASEQEAIETLYAALELGVSFWDTADLYGRGANEALLARVLKSERSRVQLATKCGIVGYKTDGLEVNGRPDYIKASCKESLKRLGVEDVDLLYLHRVDPQVPIEESVGAMGELVTQGCVHYVGLSEAPTALIRRAHREFPLTAVQSEYSLVTRGVEVEVIGTLRELGIGLVAYSPLGRGLLSGTLKDRTTLEAADRRMSLPRFSEENLQANLRLVEDIRKIAREHDCSVPQLALAWLLAQGEDVIPIPGTKRRSYLRDNVDALKLTISAKGREVLDRIASKVAGDRYSKEQLKAVVS